MQNSPVTAVLVGGGHRAFIYADYSLTHPNELKIVGIADPDKQRCDAAAKKYGFSAENCFTGVEELASKGKIADVIINGTMDNLHVSTSVPLMKLGYDMLIEKPVAVNERELEVLIDTAEKYGTKVMVCHVLRYSDFYREIKKIISEGKLGEILSIQLCENVSYHHYATSYIRGKWANSDKCGTSMLLAKCCHDMDLMMWLMGGVKPKYVSSMGGRQYFRRENAPKDAGERCLLDCPYIDTCNLSAKRIYLDLPGKWDFYVWPELYDAPYQEKYEYLKSIS
ncbi:MAG: Gfo/Idh/MocA family oxidoreductase, partial [Clostridiales bacterium]|nr:Gfo/Idh/MocA family oxidoreductase [Clostridiales bacterium]